MNRQLFINIGRENWRLLAIVSVLLLIAVTLWGYLLVPRQRQLDELRNRWTEKRGQVQAIGKVDSATQMKLIEEDLKQIISSTPESHEFPGVLWQLTDYAAKNKLSIVNMSYKPAKSTVDGLLCYSLQCSIKGSYPGIKRYLADILSLDCMPVIEKISINNNDSLMNQVVLEAELLIHLRPEKQP